MIKTVMFGATAQRIEPAVNSTSETVIMTRRP